VYSEDSWIDTTVHSCLNMALFALFASYNPVYVSLVNC